MRLLFSLLLVSGFVAASLRSTYADIFYEFSGELPSGSSSHTQVDDGETWRAVFRIVLNSSDSDSSTDVGVYLDSAVQGYIEFSGGYKKEFSDPFDTIVFNDRVGFSDGFITMIDGVSIRQAGAFIGDFVIQAQVEASELPIPVLSDDSLPGVGVSFTSNSFGSRFFQLDFTDPGFGSIEYNEPANMNVSFRAVPEPSAVGLIAICCLVFGHRRCLKL